MADLSNEIELIKDENITICYIKDFSDNFKEHIKEVLTVVCYGPTINNPEDIKYYPFKDTIKCFKERYDSKTEKTKKGMLGELIAHVLINLYADNLKVFSQYFNKEESSIRKGFDILYIDVINNCIRYGEVKSGNKSVGKTVSQTNNHLLYNAETDLKNKFTSSARYALWDNAKCDANVYMKSTANQNSINLHDLLQNDRNSHISTDKHVILISVCFSDINDRIDLQETKNFYTEHCQRNNFSETILFSIQKSTFQKIEQFFNEEYEKCNA